MGHKLTASQETALLQATVRAAHEAISALNDLMAQAQKVLNGYLRGFDKIHQTQVQQLSNYFQTEMNRQSAELNVSVDNARKLILEHFAQVQPEYDAKDGVIRLYWPNLQFDEHVPPPYPHATPEETS